MAELASRYRGFRVVPKRDSLLCRAIDVALRVITLGGQDRFMSEYITTLGAAVYVPDNWEARSAASRYCVMRHEAVHVQQFRRLTWPGITLVYLLLPLPLGFAGGRARLEWEGYRETLTATWQVYGPQAAQDPRLHDEIVRRFTGPDYAWMWVHGRTLRRAIARHLVRLEADPPPVVPR